MSATGAPREGHGRTYPEEASGRKEGTTHGAQEKSHMGQEGGSMIGNAASCVKHKACDAACYAKDTVGHVANAATASRARATTTAAVAGGAAGGIAGGTMGTLAGAALGVVPALFTFGLSIPVGAAIGLAAGTAAGTGAGAVGGGAAGFTGYTYRKEIGSSENYVKTKACDSANHVKQSVKSLVGSGTGGTV